MISRLRDFWVRSVWSQIRESRDTAACEARRADDLAARLTRVQRELDKKRHENRKLREENVRMLQREQFLSALGVDDLPEVEA